MASPEYEAMRNDMQRTAMIEGIPRLEAKIDRILAHLGLADDEGRVTVEGGRIDEDEEGSLSALDLDGGTLAALEEAGIADEEALRAAVEEGGGIPGIGEARMKKIRRALGMEEAAE